MRLVYVTSSFPFGHGEGFLIAELDELERQGHEVTVVPTLARGPIVHDDARRHLDRTRRTGLVSREVGAAAGRAVRRRGPAESLATLGLVSGSGRLRTGAKNTAVLAKAFWLSELVREVRAEHVHAHWGGTSATLAMIASRLSATPWSMTLHRWDIRENNLLRAKTESAAFVRTVSLDGLRDAARTIGPTRTPLEVVHMGVPLAPRIAQPRSRSDGALRVLVAANFLEVKGHRYLVEAAGRLAVRGVPVVIELAGDGPLRGSVERQIAAAGLGGRCIVLGQLSHDDLLSRLARGDWDCVALASIETPSGEKEGIPVIFLEAMSHGLPVVGTAVGAIPELLGGGAALLVPQRDPDALADALGELADDGALRATLGLRGRERVEREFAVEAVVQRLVELFRSG